MWRALVCRRSPLAYSVGALRAGLRAHPVPAHVRCDGADAFAGRAWQVTVAVTGAFGGGAQVEADPRDGILDVIVIEAGSRARLLVHAYRLRAGRLRERDDVHRASGREIEVEIDGGDGFNVDGELVDARRLRLSVRPRAFQVVVG
jgi:diacylglycerol kinase (ATP)